MCDYGRLALCKDRAFAEDLMYPNVDAVRQKRFLSVTLGCTDMDTFSPLVTRDETRRGVPPQGRSTDPDNRDL